MMDYFTIFVFMLTIDQRKKEGFEGQKAIVIPKSIIAGRCEKNIIINTLYVTDIGYYPKARFHFRKRPDGAFQHILIYCDKGEGTVRISEKVFRVLPGEFFIIPRKTPHQYSADPLNPWTIYWIHFKGSSSDSITNLLVNKQAGYKAYLKYPDSSIKLFNEIYNQLEKGYGNDKLLYANMCLSHFLTTFIFNEKYSNPLETEIKNVVDETIDYFRNNIHRMLTLHELADYSGFSVSHFSYLFKKKTGFPPLEYFNHLKIQQACQYLLFTKMKVKEIASILGMSDPYYFSRSFTQIMGVSPKHYRESRASQPEFNDFSPDSLQTS